MCFHNSHQWLILIDLAFLRFPNKSVPRDLNIYDAHLGCSRCKNICNNKIWLSRRASPPVVSIATRRLQSFGVMYSGGLQAGSPTYGQCPECLMINCVIGSKTLLCRTCTLFFEYMQCCSICWRLQYFHVHPAIGHAADGIFFHLVHLTAGVIVCSCVALTAHAYVAAVRDWSDLQAFDSLSFICSLAWNILLSVGFGSAL